MEHPNDTNPSGEAQDRVTQPIVRMMLVLGTVVLAGVLLLTFRYWKSTAPATEPTVYAPSFQEQLLVDRLSFYPEHVTIGQPLPDCVLYDAGDRAVRLSDYRGKYVVLSFFASWCGDCEQQFENLGDLDAFFQEYSNVVWLPVDRLEGEKETKEQGIDYLQYRGIQTPCLFDRERAAYDALGGQMIPTTLFLDRNGNLQLCHAGVLKDQSQLKAMLSYLLRGRNADLEAFVVQHMMSADGGVYTGVKPVSGLAAGHDVLSESQGLLMEYAAELDDAHLFLQALRFVQDRMMSYPLPVWVLEDEQQISVNALLDDLRMLKALDVMQRRHGGYREITASLAESIALYNIQKQRPVDFYDFSQKTPASRFTLCYADFAALQVLCQYVPIVEDVQANTEALVEGGYISDAFPFYRNYYDYSTGTYDSSSINMVEGLYTLYHLAEVGRLKQTSLNWIREKLEQGALFARYDVTGEVTVGYEYESPAIYALVGLIALEVDDPELLTRAVERLEEFRVFDAAAAHNGAIGGGTMEQMAAYDQLITLLLYAKMGA